MPSTRRSQGIGVIQTASHVTAKNRQPGNEYTAVRLWVKCSKHPASLRIMSSEDGHTNKPRQRRTTTNQTPAEKAVRRLAAPPNRHTVAPRPHLFYNAVLQAKRMMPAVQQRRRYASPATIQPRNNSAISILRKAQVETAGE
jgi:hypothetical protein